MVCVEPRLKVARKLETLDFLCLRSECREVAWKRGRRGRVVRVAGASVGVRRTPSARFQLVGYCPDCNSDVYKFGKESSVKQFGYLVK